MEFAAYMTRRYLRSRRHSRFLGRSGVIAILGVTIGVAVRNITLAVMNGFHSEMRRTFVENMPMVSVITGQPEGFPELGALMDTIGADPDVVGVAPYIRQEAVLSARLGRSQLRHRGVVVWGIEPHLVDTVQPLAQYISPGPEVLRDLGTGEVPRVILGADLANSLYAALGDTVIITAPSGELDPQKLAAESRNFVVAGYFDTGMYEFDSRFVYIDLEPARDFFGYHERGATLVGVKVRDLMRADKVADRLE
ncbi:hypothetical protein DRQ50_01835, partial [bacterium]